MADAPDHGWHLFDELSGIEVRRKRGVWQARQVETVEPVVEMDDAQFDRLRAGEIEVNWAH